jgi:hypothetical protein
MTNIWLEAPPKGRPELWAFLWLVAAGVAGTICGFAFSSLGSHWHWINSIGLVPFPTA